MAIIANVSGTRVTATKGALYFPENLGDKPSMKFTPIRATYEPGKAGRKAAKTIGQVLRSNDSRSINLLVPRGLQMSDAMNYDSNESALVELLSKVTTTTGATGNLPNVTQAEATALMGQLPLIGDTIEKFRRKAVTENQVTLNPGEFMLFRSPQPRTFSLSYKFMPKSSWEQQAVNDIIREFRRAMYPLISGDLNAYNFPDAWLIEFIDAENYVEFPEVVLTDLQTTYNPNTMAYHEGGKPVEYDLTLTFKELVPISRDDVDGGF